MDGTDDPSMTHSSLRQQASKTSSLLRTFQEPARASTDAVPDASEPPDRGTFGSHYSVPASGPDADGESSDDEPAEQLQHKMPSSYVRMDSSQSDSTTQPSFAPRTLPFLNTPSDTSSPADTSPRFSPAYVDYHPGYGTSPLGRASGVDDVYLAQRMHSQMNVMAPPMQRMQFMYAPQQNAGPPQYMAPQMAHQYPMMQMPGMYGQQGMASGPGVYAMHPMQMGQSGPWNGMPQQGGGMSRSPMGLPMSPIVTDPSRPLPYGAMQYPGNPYAMMMMPMQQQVGQQQHMYAGQPQPGTRDRPAAMAPRQADATSTAAKAAAPPVASPLGSSPAGPMAVAAAGQASNPFRSARRKRFKASGESVYPKGISKAGNSWRIQVQVLSDELVTVPMPDSMGTRTVMKKYRFSRNMSDYNAALWLYEVAILLSDRPASVEDQIATGNYSVLVGQGLVTNMDEYYDELGRQVLLFAKMEAGNMVEVPMAIRAYNNLTARNGVSLASTGRSIIDPP